MSGPSPAYLANVWASFPPANSTQPMASYPPPPDVPPAMLPPAGPPPPPLPDPNANEALGMSVMGPSSTQGPPPPPPAPPVPSGPAGPPQLANVTGFQPEGFGLVARGGGATPAHEVERRGPSLRGAQDVRNLAYEATIDRVGARNQDMAQQEYAMALDHERSARAREAAQQQSIAERDEEMAQRQTEFDSSVKQASQLGQLDRGRFFASRSTGQKIAAIGELMLAGFRGAPSMVTKRIDDDVRAQEFAYHAARDTVQAQQTAFSMAMQKYQNADAARAFAKAAALDVVQAQMAQLGAKYKGTDAANRADMAMAALQDEKMVQIANGIQFVPRQVQGRVWVDEDGITYNEAQAREYNKGRIERNAKRGEQTATIGGQLVVEKAKGEHELQKAALTQQRAQHERGVQLPNGDTVQAPTDKEAETIRGLSTAVANAQQLVNEAKDIRSDPSWIVSPTKAGRLNQIQSELTLAFKDRGQLGALSGPDMDLALNATADLTSVKPGVADRLDAFAKVTNRALQNRVRTIPGTPHTARGELPPEAAADFKAYGKK